MAESQIRHLASTGVFLLETKPHDSALVNEVICQITNGYSVACQLKASIGVLKPEDSFLHLSPSDSNYIKKHHIK